MPRPDYLNKYIFDWELFDVIVGGTSALDSKFLISQIFNVEQVNGFLKGYGIDPDDAIGQAEIFGNFQETIQFIKRYFLKEGTEDGLDLTIPNALYMITDIRDLFLMAAGNSENSQEERLWAEAILKIMHTILHVDKDLRSDYFNIIQTQIFDRFYKNLHRGDDNQLYLKDEHQMIELVSFDTKSKKSRDSVIIKLLHKAESVAEELFDRVGIRIITNTKFDTIRVVNFLILNNIVTPHNIKPSRSVNTIINIEKLRENYQNLLKISLRNDLSEERFLSAINRDLLDMKNTSSDRNQHTSDKYKSIQFTCRQLIKHKNPFVKEFLEIKKMAKLEKNESEFSRRLLGLDTSLISREVQFFYPYEVQIVDNESHKSNTGGEASHNEYKKSQRLHAMKRVFKLLIDFKGLSVE